MVPVTRNFFASATTRAAASSNAILVAPKSQCKLNCSALAHINWIISYRVDAYVLHEEPWRRHRYPLLHGRRCFGIT